MFQKVSNWWNRDRIAMEQRLKEFESRYEAEMQKYQDLQAAEQAARIAAEQKLEATQEQINMYRQRDDADEARRNGTDPWIEIKSADFSALKGIHIELDWNDAFVQYLKDNGFKARDEETIVQKWLAFLYEDLINRLEQKVIDNSDKPRVNDFE